MANIPRLETSDIPEQTPQEAAATVSPARGAEMRNFLQTRLQKNRAPPLVHSWDFWHDRQTRPTATNTTTTTSSSSSNPNGTIPTTTPTPTPAKYEDRLEILASVDDVRKFWSLFNNFDITRLPLRDSIHLFHKGIRPIWEDPRNTHGGSWTFRVPKALAPDFWKEICMMAIGEQLQAAVESERTTFRDDVCGVSLAVRFNTCLVQVWNRDAGHQEGVEGILRTVVEGLSEALRPREGSFYYKRHSEHAGFTGSPASADAKPVSATVSLQNGVAGEQEIQSLDAVLDGSATT